MNLAIPVLRYLFLLIFIVYITPYNVCLILNSHFCNKEPTYVQKERIKTTTMGQRDEMVM